MSLIALKMLTMEGSALWAQAEMDFASPLLASGDCERVCKKCGEDFHQPLARFA